MRKGLHVWGFGSLVLSMLFVSMAQGKSTLQPGAWDAQIKLPEAVDTNSDPRVVEVNLEASVAHVTYAAGRTVEAWTYNGGIPGRLIRTRVGDRLIVHFTNKLPQPTTVHWHGMRVPIEMDGVPGISQPEVQPGGSFTYDFIVPDAGLFWYHPHVMSCRSTRQCGSLSAMTTGPEHGCTTAISSITPRAA